MFKRISIAVTLLMFLTGCASSQKSNDVYVDVDTYSNSSTIKTDYDNGVLLRMFSDGEMKEQPYGFQVYTNLWFKGKWGHISHARTEDGQKYTTSKIDTDVMCSKYGCNLKETIIVTLPISFLDKNRDGFNMKYYGKQNKEIHVSSYLVNTMIKGLDKIGVAETDS